MFKEFFILKTNDSYYGGIYHGEIMIVDYYDAERFNTKADLLNSINSYEWIEDDLEGYTLSIQTIVEHD